MPDQGRNDPQTKDEITASLTARAAELWGRERAAALRVVIEQTAANILQISLDPAPADEEPGFYF